jgi:hypothetical protein
MYRGKQIIAVGSVEAVSKKEAKKAVATKEKSASTATEEK